jgi:hypothetical protein
MALVNIDSVIHNLLQKLKKLSPPRALNCYLISATVPLQCCCLGTNTFLVRERGYREEEQITEKDALQNRLKLLIKYEFPRSRKIRMYQVGIPQDLEKLRKKL